MNILFLDWDGCLNSKQHFLMLKEHELAGQNTPQQADMEYMKTYTDAKNVWCLKYIMDSVSDLKIVISSAWRNHFEIEQFKELFKHYGLDGERIIGKTPRKLSSTRSQEIRLWLEGRMEERVFAEMDTWVALDDKPIFDLEDNRKPNEVLTDPWVGLTMQDAFKIIAIFKPGFVVPLLAI